MSTGLTKDEQELADLREQLLMERAKIARVEAVLRFWMNAGDLKAAIRAALADDVTQRPDVAHEEDSRCTELTCPQHGPANRAKKEGR